MKSESKKQSGSQSVRLNKLIAKIKVVVVTCAVLLLLFIACNFIVSAVKAEQLENALFLNQYRLGSKTLTASVRAYAVTGDKTHYDAYMKELNDDKNRDIAWAGLKENRLTDSEWSSMEKIAELSNGLVPLEEEAMEYAAGGDTTKATDLVFGEEYESAIQKINTLTDKNISNILDREKKESNIFNTLMMISQILFVLSFVYIVLEIIRTIKFAKDELLQPIILVSEQMNELSQGHFHNEEIIIEEDDSEVGQMVHAIHFMKKNYSDMIMEISSVLEQMGQGNYKIQITKQYVGEFEKIKDSLHKIVDETKDVMLTLQDTAKQIDGGSEQLAQASVDLAEGSTAQAVQVSELAKKVDVLAKSMEQSSEEAKETVAIASEAGHTLSVGNEKMQELKQAIGEISSCSNEIRTIIETIEVIAEQTNLLSLNAAIEAARAGEAGKGFAVVAEQVKNLAEESATAAGETTHLIETTVEAVARGIKIAEVTVENMNEVMKGAMTATKKMEQVAGILMQDVDDMNRIDDNISKVAEIVDNNSATSQETAAVSQEQSAQVATMVQMMDRFEF